MNNDGNVEITYLTYPIIVKRKNYLEEFLTEIYSKLEKEKIIPSAKIIRKKFEGFLVSDEKGQTEITAFDIFAKSKNPTLKDVGLDKYDYLTIINAELGDIENESGTTTSLPGLDKSDLVETGFSQEAPDYRIIYDGLTGEGKCINKTCIAYKKFVLNKLKDEQSGYGTFDILQIRKEFVCPMCKNPILKFTNFHFYLCKYSWTGLYLDEEADEPVNSSISGVANSKKGSKAFSEFKSENNKDFIEYKFEIVKLEL
jgi:hypothetical protein